MPNQTRFTFPRWRWLILAVFTIISFTASSAWAAVTLPLEGYCRPGRYFPIRVDGSDAAISLSFVADGCAPTSMQAGVGGPRVVPMLATGLPTSLQIKGASASSAISLHILDDRQRLIASMTADVSAAATQFPGQELVLIRLDPADPLPGAPAAWETLDAVLLDSAVFSRVTDNQRSALLAGGVTLIATGDSPPDQRWPWQRRGIVWVLSCAPAGPVGEVVNEDLYSPTYAWAPGWPTEVRRQVMGVGALVVLVTIALMLYPKRWTRWTALLLAVAAGAGIIAWRRSLGSVSRAGGDIIVARGGLVQRDEWVYERARESSEQTIPWSGWTHPLFGSDSALRSSDLKLVVLSNGDLQFSYSARTGRTMAFVRREVLPDETPQAALPVRSPMLDLAKSVYLQHGTAIAGEIPGSTGRWSSVAITGESISTAP